MKKLVVLVITFCSLIACTEAFYPQVALANSADFSVNAILPENQKNPTSSYFDFDLFPTEQKVIEIELSNTSTEEQRYSIQVNTATTNINGVIDYTEMDRERDSSLAFGIGDISKVVDSVTVPKGETLRIPIELTMPDQAFKGSLLGGITVSEVMDKQENQQISNRFSYSIAIKLSQGDSVPEIELDLIGVPLSQINRRNVISATLQNSAPTIVNDLSVEASIYRKGQEKPLFHRKESGMRMAPNSNFDFWVETNNQPLRAGTYTMNVQARTGEKEWELSKEFEITAEEAKNLNDTAVELETPDNWLYVWIIGGLCLVLLGILVTLGIKRKQGVK